jgi:hypothetical protein
MNTIEKSEGKVLVKKIMHRYNMSLLHLIKQHLKFSMQLTKMIFVKWVHSVWFSFLYFVSKFNNKVLCNMLGFIYPKYNRISATNLSNRFVIYEGRDKFDNGQSKICRVNVSPILSLDEDEWQRLSEKEPSEEIVELKNKVRSMKTSHLYKKEIPEEFGLDLNYLEDMMKRAKDEIKPKSN